MSVKLRKLFSLFTNKKRPVFQEKSNSQRIEEIFQELKDISKKRQRFTRYLKQTQEQKEDLSQYQLLTEEDRKRVSMLLGQYKNVIEKRRFMEGRLIKNNPALRIIETYQREIPDLINEIQTTESNQRYAQQDILYLENERDYLYDYRETLIAGYRALKFVAIGLVIILGIISLGLLTMVQALRQNIFILSSIVTIVALFFGFAILIFKDRIEYELEKNEAMQKKAMKLLNRAKIRYFHHTNYLNFQYRKLGIENVNQLQGHYKRYLKNKNNEIQYQGLNKKLREIEDQVFDILYGIGIEQDLFDRLGKWADIQNVEQVLRNLDKEDENTNKQLKALDAYEQELTQEAFILTEISPELSGKVGAFIDELARGEQVSSVGI